MEAQLKPIEVAVTGTSPLYSDEISSNMLDLGRWPDFKGYRS